jgi:hypothetical protein
MGAKAELPSAPVVATITHDPAQGTTTELRGLVAALDRTVKDADPDPSPLLSVRPMGWAAS